jgi:hypothetical protein
MAVDTSGTYTYNPNQPTQQAQPNPNNGTWAGGVNTMVKALLDGNDQYKKQQMQQAAQGGQAMAPPTPMAPGGGPAMQPGAPMSLSPPTDPSSMGGGLGQPQAGSAPMMMDPAFASGAPPVSVDPVTQALFSPIPGVSNG